MLITVLLKKLDYESFKLFEESLENPKIMPNMEQLFNFLIKRHQMLDSIKGTKKYSNGQTDQKFKQKQVYHSTTKKCVYCDGEQNMRFMNVKSLKQKMSKHEKSSSISKNYVQNV
jgi:membrane-bound lytic murein transglycosylase MltF